MCLAVAIAPAKSEALFSRVVPNRDLGINRWELFERDIKTAASEPLSTLGQGWKVEEARLLEQLHS